MLAVLLSLASAAVWASGLQVAPMMLTITAPKTAAALWLSNTGKDELHAQVRIYQWTQSGFDGKKLTPTTALVVSPPIVDLAPGQKQLVRVIRVGEQRAAGGKNAAEQAYRLIVNELPPPKDKQHAGLNFILRYSLPVFLESVASGKPRAPKLRWQLKPGDNNPTLIGTNNGDKYARLTNLSIVTADGRQIVLHQGLFGYVLAHASRKWQLRSLSHMPAPGGSIRVKVNDKLTTLSVEVAHSKG